MNCQIIFVLVNKAVVGIVLSLLLLVSGCAKPRGPNSPEVTGLPQPPNKFEVKYTVKNSRVSNPEVEKYILDQLPGLDKSHQGVFLGELVFVLRSNKYPTFQWLVKMPYRRDDSPYEINGSFIAIAKRYSRYLPVERWDGPPPSSLTWQVRFKNKKIIDQSIMDSRLEYGEFSFDSKDSIKKIVTIVNEQKFPGCIWKGRYGLNGQSITDGNRTVTLKLINRECYDYSEEYN